MKKITLLFSLFLIANLTFGQGQSCSDPIVISSLPFSTSDNTSNYGNNYGTADRPDLGGEQIANGTGSAYYLTGDDAVYSFTPDHDGLYSFNLTNNDTWVGFWLFEGCSPFTSVVARHTATSGVTRSFPNLNLSSGTTYYVVISNWPSPDSIDYTLDVVEIDCDQVVANPTIAPDCSNNQFSIDVDVTDIGDGTQIFDGSDYYDITSTGIVTVGPYTSGSDITIEILHTDSACDYELGDFSYDCPPANDTCAGVIDLGTLTSPYSASTVGADNTFIVDCLSNTAAPDVVYSIVVPAGYTLFIGQTYNNYDSKHRLAYGGSCPGDNLVDCIDDPDYTELSWTNDTGSDQTAFWVQSAYSTGSGDYTLEWSLISCTQAEVDATISADCDNSQFFVDVDVTLLGDATGIFDGTDTYPISSTGVVQVGPYADSSDVTLNIVHSDSGCDYELGTYTFSCPPANDDFANAIGVTCGGNYTGSTSNATLDEDDAPDGFGADMDAPNVWFSFTGTGTVEDVTLDLCPSSYDTSVLVYTGSSGNLTLVAGNDDNGSQCSSGTRSYLSFTSDGTSTYFIAVEGYNSSSTGLYDMTVTCEVACTPAQTNQDCATAETISVDGNPVTVDNTCATVNATQTSCDSFNNIVDVWYTFVAPVSGQVDVTTELNGTATAAHVAVYSGTCGSLTGIYCSSSNSVSTTLEGLTEGETYYLQLWNNGSEEGTFDVTLTDETLTSESFDLTSNFTYYPNPVQDILTLKSDSKLNEVKVYNMLGQEVLSRSMNSNNANIDLSELNTGSYFIKVSMDNSFKTFRVLKK